VSVRLRSDLQPLPLRLVLRQRGELIRQGAPGDGLWLIETGALRAAAITDTGRELVVEMLGPGDAAGEPTGVPSSVSVRALRPCRLAPILPRAAADVLAARAHRAAALAAELAWMDVRTRVARRLDDLAERFGRPVEDGRLILLPLTQDEVAAIAGTSRESANRALRSLVDAGTIRVAGRGRYVVRSPMRLRSVDGPT
jgi:CRP/FNR family cyclic AMP-dependent transcriptional regulator